MWASLYDDMHQPEFKDIKSFVNNELWDSLCLFIENKYKVMPKMEYSKCSMQKGWNVKYKKGGRSICTLYPMDGYFIVLIVIGAKEQFETEFAIESCSSYVRDLYNKTPFSCGGRWLMIEVKDGEVLEDVFKLIQIRTDK